MSFLLDTDHCSAHLKYPDRFHGQFIQYGGRLAIPTIVLGEVLVWAYQHGTPSSRLALLDDHLLSKVTIIDYNRAAADRFGRLRAVLRREGITVAPLDLQIAATALAHDLTLVTHNTRHFERVPGLRLEDWLA